MGATSDWKIYRDKEYVASFKYTEDAAMFVAASGGEVRFTHRCVVWREGQEAFSAGESYDRAAVIMQDRKLVWQIEAKNKWKQRIDDFNARTAANNAAIKAAEGGAV